jgi:hypothetical protein
MAWSGEGGQVQYFGRSIRPHPDCISIPGVSKDAFSAAVLTLRKWLNTTLMLDTCR